MSLIVMSVITLASQLLTCSAFVLLQPRFWKPNLIKQVSDEDDNASLILYAKGLLFAPEQDLDESAYKHVVPVGVQCKSAIFAAGLPRSGSTLQQKLVEKALHHIGQDVSYEGYWDWPRHMFFSKEKAAQYYTEEDQLWLSLSPEDVVLYKSHEFDAIINDLCRSRIVVTVHRHLLDEYKSAVIAFNRTSEVSVADAANTVKVWSTWFAAWKRQPNVLVLEYEDMVAGVDAAYARIVQHLAPRLGKEEVLHSPIPSVASIADEEQNKAIPSSSGKASEAFAQACRAAMQGARNLLSGTPDDPTRLGLKWGLEEPASS